jgi:hypothetical protein
LLHLRYIEDDYADHKRRQEEFWIEYYFESESKDLKHHYQNKQQNYNADDHYQCRFHLFVPPLVKAYQQERSTYR